MKKILYTLMLCLISAFAFAQEPAPPSPAKPFTAQFYVSTTGGDTTIYIYKVVQGVVYGWTRLAKSSETNLVVGRTIKGDGDATPLNVNMDSTATAINNFLLAKNANGDIVPINANFSTDNNTIIFNGIKINANAGIILNPSLQSGTAWFAKIDSATHMIVKDTSERLKLYINALTRVRGNMLGVDSLLVGGRTASTRTILQPGSGNYYAPSRSMHQTAARYMNANADTSIIYSDWVFRTDTTLFKGVNPVSFKTKLYSEIVPTSNLQVLRKFDAWNIDGTLTGDHTADVNGHTLLLKNGTNAYGDNGITLAPIFGNMRYGDADTTSLISASQYGATLSSSSSSLFYFNTATASAQGVFLDNYGGGANSYLHLGNGKAIRAYDYQKHGIVYDFRDLAFLTDSSLVTKKYVDSVAATIGGTPVTSVSGTTNRITSTGGTTPVINISSTFEALLGKVANPLSQFASTTSAQLLGVISDESGTGALLFAGSPALTGTPTTPTATGVTATTQIASTAQVHLAIIADTASVTQNRTGAQSQFSNLAGRIVTNTSNISANTTAIGLKQPRIVGNKPSATSTTYTTADSVTQVLANLNSGIIANTASISAIPTYTASLGVSKVGNDFRSDTIYNQTVLNFFPKGDTRWLKISDTTSLARKTGNAAMQQASYAAIGTGGNGFLSFLSQSASPSRVSGVLKLYRDSVGSISYMNGLVRRTLKFTKNGDITTSFPFKLVSVLADSTDVAASITGLSSTYVPLTRTVAGFALSSNVTLASHTNGFGLSGSAYNGSASQSWVVDTASAVKGKTGYLTDYNNLSGRINLKLNISDTTTMLGNYIPRLVNSTIPSIKTFAPTVSAAVAGTNFNSAHTATANNQIQFGIKQAMTFSDGAFTGVIHGGFSFGWGTSFFSGTDATGTGDTDLHFGTATPTTTNYAFRGNTSNTILNAPGAGGVFAVRTNNTTGMTMFATRNVLFQNGGTATDSTAYRVSVMGRLRVLQFVAASTNDSLMAFNPTTHATRMTKLVAGTGVGITYAPGTITLATANTPIIQGSADLTGQTAAGNVATFTVGAATATFNISSYINVTAVSVDVIQGQITYTDENNTTQTISLSSLSAIGNSTYSPITIRAKNATVITVKTNLTTGAGSITFDTGARISQL